MASSYTYSHMITCVQSAMSHTCKFDQTDLGYEALTTCSIKIGIRNFKSLLVYFRKLDADVIEKNYPALEFCMEIIKHFMRYSRSREAVEAVEWLHEAYEDLIIAIDDGINQPCPLQLEASEVVSIINCVVENNVDFFRGVSNIPADEPTDAFQVLEALGVQMRFMKHLLGFAMQAHVELQDSLLPHIQPIAINAATLFTLVSDVSRALGSFREVTHYLCWFKELESKCLAVNRMAADPQVCRAYAQALIASRHAITLPKDDVDEDVLRALLHSFISLLWDMLRHQSESRIKDQFKVIYERLRFSRAILKKNSVDENRRSQIGALMCDAGAFIFLLHRTDPGQFEELLERFDEFQAQLELKTIPSSKADVDQVITDNSTSIHNISEDGSGRDLDITPSSSHQHPQSSLPQVVGFKEDELQSLLDRLTRGSKELCIVPICGMAGLGKTTLALKVYNHSSTVNHFRARAWRPISQVMDKKKVLVQLLNQILTADYSNETEEDLANKLRRSLKGRRYLIFLDDIWSADVWDSLKASFPNDSTGSRIILTSRCLDIVPRDQQPYLLRLRSASECFEILQKKLSHEESWNAQVTELVMEIAEKCNGLPLTVTLVAGLLATSEQESWKGILAHLSSSSLSGCEESVLELSYRHLPDYLQPCFLYFGAFPEDEEVSVKRLIRLWIAEGFVRKEDQPKRIEDAAREYVEKLIERSLVMAVKGRSIGGVSSFRIHDVVHDFCRSKATQESLFHLLQQSHDQLSDFNEPSNLQRLVIYSLAHHFRKSRLFCPRAQSILLFTDKKTHLLDMPFIIQIFHILKVLDISQIFLMNDIPSDIQLLTRLRYLAIKTYVPIIPSSVGNLSNLETFIADFCRTVSGKVKEVSFPDTLWNLQKLRYLGVVVVALLCPLKILITPLHY